MPPLNKHPSGARQQWYYYQQKAEEADTMKALGRIAVGTQPWLLHCGVEGKWEKPPHYNTLRVWSNQNVIRKQRSGDSSTHTGLALKLREREGNIADS
ncbi:unnamed protein product [Arctia plantaginis]|uniref:Uncharacterized protein n=1 Tax=Arctia plantaginis TaxID=874455 RepID=A0A8S1BGJ1_ARCPL|nr:unnamed protein product [Arctia plantaginis]